MHYTFEDSAVWKQCWGLQNMISTLTKKFTQSEKYILTDQILRSPKSPCSNIAEGHGRFHYQLNILFCRVAKGSLSKTCNHLTDAIDYDSITASEFDMYKNQIQHCLKILNGYILYLKKQIE